MVCKNSKNFKESDKKPFKPRKSHRYSDNADLQLFAQSNRDFLECRELNVFRMILNSRYGAFLRFQPAGKLFLS